MRLRHLAAAAALLPALVACDASIAPSASPAPSWGPLAVIPPQDGTDLARAEGTLLITDACVYLEAANGVLLLVWPADRVAWDDDARTITFRGFDDRLVTVTDGDRVVLGGGSGGANPRWVVPPAATCAIGSLFGVGVIDVEGEAR